MPGSYIPRPPTQGLSTGGLVVTYLPQGLNWVVCKAKECDTERATMNE